MKIKFKEINLYQARNGAIMLNLGENLLFELTEKQLINFNLYELDDFSEEDYKKYYKEDLNDRK